jgi:hypothetical protein
MDEFLNPVYVLHSNQTRVLPGLHELQDLISESYPDDKRPTKAIIEVNTPKHQKFFKLWLVSVDDVNGVSAEEAVAACWRYLAKRNTKGPECIYFQENESKRLKNAVLMVMHGLNDAESLNSLSFQERQLIDERRLEASQLSSKTKSLSAIGTNHLWGLWSRYKPLSIYVFTVMAMLAMVALYSYHRRDDSGEWIRYNTEGSTGPRVQLEMRHYNVSSWVSEHVDPNRNDQWEVRIDDQAMIPSALMTEEEKRYQQWFQNRYPEKQLVVDHKAYINESWLGSMHILVPSDHQFHFAHCVLVLRRYWIAKETGTHVCPRDIDYRHMKHCLDSLDEMAFIDGPRKADDNWSLIWKTKACY